MGTHVVATPGQEPPRLEEAAALAEDPCDIALAAMPAHVIGDLCDKDEAWLQHHIAECGYCRNEMSCYEKVDRVLGACCAVPESACVPPVIKLPKRDVVWYTRIPSPLGDLILAATEEGLREIEFGRNHTEAEFVKRIREAGGDPVPVARIEDAPLATRRTLERAAAELDEYFGGRRSEFDVPLDWGHMPPFQRAVLEATASVPFGHVDTYAGIARRIGNPKATRAVGNALGRNPIPVIVPCHRVIRSDATLGGYTGGLNIKELLLNLEGVRIP
jgi:methylated-DNA-[protein]-cysteine S-methyltransferase